MSLEVRYEKSKLVLPGISCHCGMEHHIPDIDVYIGSGILDRTASYIKQAQLGKKALVVTDNVLADKAGKRVAELLQAAGFQVDLCVLTRQGELHPDQSALGELLLALDLDTDFLVGVGSGSITDITRYVAVNTNRRFAIVATAASMDGYTSVVAPLLNKNLKVNKPASCPDIIVCDLDLLATAPPEMMISGFGDVIGKYIAKADWILGNIVNNEPYCPACVDLIDQAVERCVKNIDGIRNRTLTGTQNLIEALILAGLTILIIGQTRPVASIEHNMGHYWEMMKLQRGEAPPSHGTAVGVATGYVLRFFEEFLRTDITAIDPQAIYQTRQTAEQREQRILAKYGVQIARPILRENPYELADWSEQERRIRALQDNFATIKEQLAFLPSFVELLDMYRRLGAPLTAADIGIDRELLQDALLYAKDYRNRYTIFKSAEELGILETLVEKVLQTS